MSRTVYYDENGYEIDPPKADIVPQTKADYMSGIYIPGMKKPENCYECPCYNDEYGKCQIEGNWEKGYVYDATPDWCPLTPVPEHGRLIDADAIDTSYSDPEVVETLNDAPTIIPADKE